VKVSLASVNPHKELRDEFERISLQGKSYPGLFQGTSEV